MLDFFQHIICGQDYITQNGITIHNPTVREIRDYGASKYMSLVHLIVMRSYDDAVSLWDAGIDYEEVPDFLTFFNNVRGLTLNETSILFGDLNFEDFDISINEDNLQPIITNGSIVIDDLIYAEIVDYLRLVYHISGDIEYKVGNKKAKEFLISRMKRKIRKNSNSKSKTDFLSNMCSALICRCSFKYNYDSILDLKISQLYDSFYRILKIDEYENHVMGLYCNPMAFNKVDTTIMQWYGSYEKED